MKYPKILIALAFAVALEAESRAVSPMIQTFSQTNTFTNFTTVARNLNFNLIDTAFGQSIALNDIISISITASLNKSAGSWSITDIADAEQFVTATQSTKAWFTSLKAIGIDGSESTPALNSPFTQLIGLAPLGTETGNFGTFSTGVFGGGLDASAFSDFLGSGTFAIVLNGAQSFNVTGGAVEQSSTPPRISGNVIVTYQAVVPEPSAASLLIFGLGGVFALRRCRRKAD